MAAQTYQGGFTVHRLRTGVSTQLSLSVSGGLYVILDGDNKLMSPSWDDNGPTITPSVSNGTIKDGRWYVDMPENTAEGSRSQYLITSVDGFRGNCTVSQTGVLKFTNNVVNVKNIHNIKLTFICSVESGDVTTPNIKRSIMILVNKGNGNSYWGNILTERTTLTNTKDTDHTVMTPVLWQGASRKEHNTDYHVIWTKTDANGKDIEIAGDGITISEPNDKLGYRYDATTGALTVARDCVDGIASYECHFVSPSDHSLEYEVEGVRIADETDPYEVVAWGTDWVESSQTITVQVALRHKHENTNYAGSIEWKVAVTDRIRYRVIDKKFYSFVAADAKFTMQAHYMRLPAPQTNGAWNGWAKRGEDAAHDTKITGDDMTNWNQATECEVEINFTASI